MKKRFIPMNLQLFAEGGDGGTGNQQNNNQQDNSGNGFQFDYEKLANIVAGRQTVTEDKVLSGYFRQQGLSKEEADQAMREFKEQKAKNTPDVTTLQTNLANSNKALIDEKVNNQAILTAVELGIDTKSIPYILKLADMTKVVDAEGKVNADEVKAAINKVLEDVPAFKGQSGNQNNNDNQSGGFKFGGGANNNNENQEDMLRNIFGVKKS